METKEIVSTLTNKELRIVDPVPGDVPIIKAIMGGDPVVVVIPGGTFLSLEVLPEKVTLAGDIPAEIMSNQSLSVRGVVFEPSDRDLAK